MRGTKAVKAGVSLPGTVNFSAGNTRPAVIKSFTAITTITTIIYTAAGLTFSGFWSLEAAPARPAPAKSSGMGDVSLSFEHESARPDLALGKNQERSAQALAWYVEGQMAEDDGDSDKALAAYEKVLQLDPARVDVKLSVRVASEYVRRGNVAEGISLLKDTISAQPKEPLPYVTVAYLYLKQLQKPEPALKYAKMAVEVAPYDLRAHQALVVVYDSQGQTAEAEKAVDRAAGMDSADAEYWFGIAELYLKMYARETSEDQMIRAKLEKVTAIFQKALACDPENPVVLNRVADFHAKTGNIKAAIPLYLKAIAENSGASESLQTDVREKLAQTFNGMGKRKEAIEMLQGLIKLNPLRSEAYVLLGDIYRQGNEMEQALASYQQAVLTAPNDPRNYLMVAKLALFLKKNGVAIETLVDARGKFGSPEITTMLAVAYSQADRHQESLAMFEEALKEAQNYDDSVIGANFYLSYAEAAQKAGLFEKTVGLVRKAIEIDPEHADAGQNFLGYLWVDRGENLEEAVQLIRLALMAEPDNGAYIDSLGWYYYKKGNYDLALKELLRAVEHLPEEDAVVFDHIADTYLKLGKTAESMEYWKKALRLDPGNKSLAAKIDAHQEKVTANPTPAGAR